MNGMQRLVLPIIAMCALSPALADPVEFSDSIKIGDQRFDVPMYLSMRAETETDLVFRIIGDLSDVQDALPAMMSRTIRETCDEQTVLRVDEVRAEGDVVRLEGRLRARRWRCVDGERSTETLDQSADIETTLISNIEDGCLILSPGETDLRPDGVTGALFNLSGVTAQIEREIQKSLESTLEDEKDCFDLPQELLAFDTELTGGGFRAIAPLEGQARLGAVIDGRMEISSWNFIGLMHLLGRDGQLGD